MIIELGKKEKRLEDIYAIMGLGLTSNVYAIGRKKITLIDSGNGGQVNYLKNHLQEAGLSVSGIVQQVITHTHFDHIGGLGETLNKDQRKILVHEDEAPDLRGLIPELEIIELKDGGIVETEKGSLEVIHTPGHSRGSICLYGRNDRILFSGDTVFPRGYFGRCDLDGGDANQLVNSLKKLTKLKVDILLPGHQEPVYKGSDKQIKLSYETARNYFL